MLIKTIKFEIHNFTTHTSESYLVPNTAINYELIAGNRFTRQIQFTETFSFQAEKEMRAPDFFLETLALEYIQQMIAFEEAEEFDNDEMVGSS